jgi:hypothetical protein
MSNKVLLHHAIQNKASQVRREILEGREYSVVPMVMLKEAVLNGSQGPIFYPGTEIGKAPTIWNHKPIVVYHPVINGVGVSACEPTILETRKVGLILNTAWDNRLKAEAWIDVEKADKVDTRVTESITNQKMMEVSTGMLADVEYTEGVFDGVAYSGIARNIVSDHLALLPDQVGALSIAAGGGLLRNALNAISGDPKVKERFEAFVNSGMAQIIFNDASLSERIDMVHMAISEATKGKGWVREVFDGYLIAVIDEKLYKIPYAISDKSVTMSNDRTEVVRKVSYDPVPVNNSKGKFSMSKTTLIANLAAKAILNSEETELLNQLPESVLEKVNTIVNAKPEPPAPPATLEAVVASAPAQFQPILNAGIAAHNAQKKALCDRLLAVPNTTVTQAYLENQSLETLQALTSLVPPATPAQGAAPVVLQNGQYPAQGVPAWGAQYPAQVAPMVNGHGQPNAPHLLCNQYVGATGVAGVVVNNAEEDKDMFVQPMDFTKS